MGSRQGLLWAQSCLVITEPEPSAGAEHTGRAHSTPKSVFWTPFGRKRAAARP